LNALDGALAPNAKNIEINNAVSLIKCIASLRVIQFSQ